jgi:hypothetical protein
MRRTIILVFLRHNLLISLRNCALTLLSEVSRLRQLIEISLLICRSRSTTRWFPSGILVSASPTQKTAGDSAQGIKIVLQCDYECKATFTKASKRMGDQRFIISSFCVLWKER